MSDTLELEKKKEKASAWFQTLQNDICDAFEKIEGDQGSNARFVKTPWDREDTQSEKNSESVLKGGGEMRLMKGDVFEKVGVNFSKVHGTFSPEFATKIPGTDKSEGAFWASGISLVAHMMNPYVPAVHMNTRMICTSKCWFGGGADLTPTFENDSDTQNFHAHLKGACDAHDPKYYDEYKAWCDRYFFLPHRNETRGVGGIFYDYLDTDWDKNFAFTQDVGRAFLAAFIEIVERHVAHPWDESDKHKQQIKRGRYVEFNLLYDRGTQFGLKTGGNTEAILMSMPPIAKWD